MKNSMKNPGIAPYGSGLINKKVESTRARFCCVCDVIDPTHLFAFYLSQLTTGFVVSSNL